MSLSSRWTLRAVTAAAATLIVAGGLAAAGARAEQLKHYESNNKEFWLHPPEDWFMGDETEEQKGTAPANITKRSHASPVSVRTISTGH
jgi:hypothetical protein